MGVYPKQYGRENFLNFLRNNHVSDTIIGKFVDLPDKIIINEHEYDLYINVTWYSVDETYYSFELNYYSDELIEFLFNSKVFNDIEVSLNYLLSELIGRKYIKSEK
jgi:hypothetical protein